MRKINTLISPLDLEKSFKILNGKDIRSIHLNLKNDILSQNKGEIISKRKERLYLFIEEFVPINYLYGENTISENSKNAILSGIYATAALPPKIKKLKELYNICVYVGSADNKISYRSVSNLNDEILRILNKKKFSELKQFFSIHNITNYAEEFLNINGVTPNMFKNKFILVYSSLLNYDYSIINTDITNSGISLANIMENEGLMAQSELTQENWTKLSKLFELFLEQLLVRTIHYDN